MGILYPRVSVPPVALERPVVVRILRTVHACTVKEGVSPPVTRVSTMITVVSTPRTRALVPLVVVPRSLSTLIHYDCTINEIVIGKVVTYRV